MATNTLATYLSVMATSGELVREGESYRASTPVAASESDDHKTAETEGAGQDPADDDQSDDKE